MKNCVETFVILGMSVVLMAMALILMQPYGMAGIATAFTIAGVYIALMVLIVTLRSCRRRNEEQETDVEQANTPSDAPPPYDQVVTKPPSYKALFFPQAPKFLSVFTQNQALISTTASSGDLKMVVGLPNDLTPSLSVGPYGVLPPSYNSTEVSRDPVLQTSKLESEKDSPPPVGVPSDSPESRPRTPRRVRFDLARNESEEQVQEPEPLPDESLQESDAAIS